MLRPYILSLCFADPLIIYISRMGEAFVYLIHLANASIPRNDRQRLMPVEHGRYFSCHSVGARQLVKRLAIEESHR